MKTDSIKLDEIVISVNKIPEPKTNVAQQVQSIDIKQLTELNAQNSGEILQKKANIFVQTSQQGGGSPVIRGFEASRILLVIDGIRMNNIIYRSGHLQNIITIDNAMLDHIEVLHGPASTIYGSDALGGTVVFYTQKPLFATENQKTIFKLNAFARYGSVNNEKTGHLDFNFASKSFSWLTSFTYSKFGDLMSGKNTNPFYNHSIGERQFYVQPVNGVDSMFSNSNKYNQIQSAYSQYDILQKIEFKQNSQISHLINFQMSNSTDIPRYDRLTEFSNQKLKYAQWYYGPQKRILAAYTLDFHNGKIINDVNFCINYQNIEESRQTRKFKKNDLQHRIEKVNVVGANLDLVKKVKSNVFHFGIDAQYNTLKSEAFSQNIETGEHSPLDTRYPDGDNTLMNYAIYFSHKLQINNNLTIVDGIRFGYNFVHSTIVDTTFFKLPYSEISQNTPVYSGNIGFINTPTDDLKVALLFSSGFRAANVDDMSKIFESTAGIIIVPNSKLKPEKTINSELNITKFFGDKTTWETAIYYTYFIDAIVTDKFTFAGQDSILYDGSMSAVYANQNKETAYLYGFSSSIESQMSENLTINAMVNYTYGRIKTDTIDAPLDHIPPFMANLDFLYEYKRFSSDFFVIYNGWKLLKDYNLGGEDNEAYATTEGTPAFFTANINFSYKITKSIVLQCGVYNIFDTQYRVFASGINAPGRNIFGTIRINL